MRKQGIAFLPAFNYNKLKTEVCENEIVFLDAKTIGDDIDLSGFDKLGQVTKYPFSTSSQVPIRIRDADVIIVTLK